MPFTNTDRQQHGQSAQRALEQILENCIASGYITGMERNYRTGREGYTNASQFYAPFIISFSDEVKWVLFSTTSMRTDRIKGQQWDAFNIKEINRNITRAYLIYPDVLTEEEHSFIQQNAKYDNNEEYSALDGVLSQDSLSNMIEQYALVYLNDGQLRDRQGNEFENRVSSVLSYHDNLLKWKASEQTIEGMHYNLFTIIVDALNLDRDNTVSIHATSDKHLIGRLPTGGNPKTDVLVTVTSADGTTHDYTISCKRSSSQSVSVHQYNANAFADVLDATNVELRRLLNEFQRCGSLSCFGEENGTALREALSPYLEALGMWVLGGYGGSGNAHQWAEYILTYNSNTGTASMHGTHEYYQKLVDESVTGNFGTVFSWTYPSHRRGQSIQLKCRIL